MPVLDKTFTTQINDDFSAGKLTNKIVAFELKNGSIYVGFVKSISSDVLVIKKAMKVVEEELRAPVDIERMMARPDWTIITTDVSAWGVLADAKPEEM